MTDTLVPTSRQTLRTELLHLIEDRTAAGSGQSVKNLVMLTEKSETTVRKAVKELEAEGFIEVAFVSHRVPFYRAADKNAPEPPKGGDNMATKTKAKAATPERRGPGRPKDPEVQARDEKALKLIVAKPDGLSVGDLAEKLGVSKSLAYISVWRLRTAGTIVKAASGTRTPTWRKA